MVKYFVALLLVMAFAAPAFAQDEVAPFELTFGYGNFAMKNLVPDRHSGFITHQTINLNPTFAIDNFIGLYGLGEDANFGKIQLISELFGGKVSLRKGLTFYGTGAIGGGWLRFPDIGAGTNSAFGVKYGGGVDIPFKEVLAVKVEVTRMSYHFFEQWNSGVNVSGGIVLKISQ